MLFHILLPWLVRGIDLFGLILLVGGLIFRTVVVSSPSGRSSTFERSLPFLLLLTGLADLVLRTKMMSGRPLTELWGFLPKVLLHSHFGQVWMARTLLLCLLGGSSVIKVSEKVKSGVALIVSGLLLMTTSLSGHAAHAGDLSLLVLADWLHLVAVSAWIGGLFFLAGFLRKSTISAFSEGTPISLIAQVKRFSSLAGFSVAIILLTGSYQTWHQAGNLHAVLQTSYGQTLIAKLLLAAFILALAALNRYRILPMLSQAAVSHAEASAKAASNVLLKIVTFETGLALAIIACAALLTELPPARTQRAIHSKVFLEAPRGEGRRGLYVDAPRVVDAFSTPSTGKSSHPHVQDEPGANKEGQEG